MEFIIKIFKNFINDIFMILFDFFSPYPEELFNTLILIFKPCLLLDIGSRDASQSKKFRKILNDTEIIAIEPHPILFMKMKKDDFLYKNNIQILNFAISNFNGFLPFYVNDEQSLNGSLRKNKNIISELKVPVRTVDRLLNNKNFLSYAMWIDTEGLGFEVLKGAKKSLERTNLIHIEFETKELFSGQKTKKQIFEFLKDQGFICLSINYSKKINQGNAVFFKSIDKEKKQSNFLIFKLTCKLILKSIYRKIFMK